MRIPRNYERIVCKDGATVSIQASRLHYATPRDDDGPYTQIEAGFPSVLPPESWREYADCGPDDDLRETVFGYMPVSCVREFLDAHGGMVSGQLPPFQE